MPVKIPESDWKVLRDIKPLALDRLCERILADIVKAATDPDLGAHVKYLKVFNLVREHDKDIATAFNELSRSNGDLKLAIMNRLGLITPEELSRFSKETNNFITQMANFKP